MTENETDITNNLCYQINENNIDTNNVRSKLKELLNKHNFLKTIANREFRLGKYILLPDLNQYCEIPYNAQFTKKKCFYDETQQKKYDEWFSKPQYLTIIDDILIVPERSRIRFFENTNQIQILKGELNNIGIDLHDFENYYGNFKNYLAEEYTQYQQIRKISDLNKINNQNFLYDINWQNPPDACGFASELMIKVRNYQIKVYKVLSDHIKLIYNSIIKSEGPPYHQLYNVLKTKIYSMKQNQEACIQRHHAYKTFNNFMHFLVHDKLQAEINDLAINKIVKYDTILDGRLMKEYLKLVYYIKDKWNINDILNEKNNKTIRENVIRRFHDKYMDLHLVNDEIDIIKNKIKSDIELNNKKYDAIEQFIKIYEEKKGNIIAADIPDELNIILLAPMNPRFHDIQDIKQIDFQKVRFMMHYVYPGFEFIFKYPNQNSIESMHFSIYNDDDKRSRPEYNILRDCIPDVVIERIEQCNQKQMRVYGTNPDTIPYQLNTKNFFCMGLIDDFAEFNNYNYLFWSYQMNSLITKLLMDINCNIKFIFLYDEKKLPERAFDRLPNEVIKKKLDHLINECIYIGYYRVNTRHHPLIFLIFWNKNEKRLFMVDVMGSPIEIGSVLQTHMVTFTELDQMFQNYDVNLFKENIHDVWYVTKNGTDVIENISNLYDGSLEDKKKICKDLTGRDMMYKFSLQDPSEVNCIEQYEQHKRAVWKYLEQQNKEIGTYRPSQYTAENIVQDGGKKPNDKFFKLVKFNKVKKYYADYNPKIISKYAMTYQKKVFNLIKKTDRDTYNKYLRILNPYEYLYPEKRLLTQLIGKTAHTIDKDNIKKSSDIIDNYININILYHKILTNVGIFFWEINYQHDIINETQTNLYEINNFSSICDAIPLINDLIYPQTNMKFTSINPIFMTSYKKTIDYQLDLHEKSKKNTRYANINYEFPDSQKKYDDTLSKINKIDFLFLNMYMYYEYYNFFTHSLINMISYLYTFTKIADKFTNNATLVVQVTEMYSSLHVKILALIGYMFGEYKLVKPESNTEKPASVFIIFKKFKKNNKFIEQLQTILKQDIPIINNIGIIKTYGEDSTLDFENILNQHMPLFGIVFKNNDIKKYYKKLKRDVLKFNTKNHIDFLYFVDEIKDLVKKDKKNMLTEQYIKERQKYNLFECIQWSKKYNFRLVSLDDFDLFRKKTKIDIFKKMVSRSVDIIFSFVKRENVNITIDNDNSNNINVNMIPDYFKETLGKYTIETKALEQRDEKLYQEVKLKIDYYYQKLEKKITSDSKIKCGDVNDSLLKIIEILAKTKLISKQKTINSFHLCESNGPFVNAINFYICHMKKDVKWFWKAQYLKEKENKNKLEILSDNYDFGEKKTGDIMDLENILYYKNKYTDINLITIDCTDSLKLFFYGVVAILSILSVGGNCILKCKFPIKNNQQLFLWYLLYLSFDESIIYKPRVNRDSFDCFFVGLGYRSEQFEKNKNKLYELCENYKNIGLIDVDNIDAKFLLQLDNVQNMILDDTNDYIREKIYFIDNFERINNQDWDLINSTIKEKIDEWINNFIQKS
jgi:hypothetical protein